MSTQIIKVPDIGGDDVEVIEICVAVGDVVAEEDSLIVLESDKASMEVPSPAAGKVVSIAVSLGDNVSEGSAVLELAVEGEVAEEPKEPAAEPVADTSTPESVAEPEPPQAIVSGKETIVVPDVGGASDVDVIEVCVAVGDEIAEGDSLVVLETDKASMEVPAPKAGKVLALLMNVGDKASEGSAILELEVQGTAAPASKAPAVEQPAAKPVESKPAPAVAAAATPAMTEAPVQSSGEVYAGPAVRKLARQLGVDLAKVTGTGPKARVSKDDLHNFVKQALNNPQSVSATGTGIPAIPEVDFSKFGDIDIQPLTKMGKLTAANMQRSWLNVPHVTQFDEADITDLEDFRKSLKPEAERRGVKITPLPFMLKASALALKAYPKFNTSLTADGESLVYKNYFHVGMAVDTPAGLVVPVIRDVDKKSIWELAEEAAELAAKAKDRKLKPNEMQGGCFTVSSLGGIGGTGFTPIVNAPEVGIMGVSKMAIKPVWDGKEFAPRKMLPLSVSYDHRVINGADAGKFFTYLVSLLSDVRLLAL